MVMSTTTMPKLQSQSTPRYDLDVFETRIREYAHSEPGTLRILEAGCGRRWYLDLADIDFHLAGVDLNSDSMRMRTDQVGDLDEAIVGDLREVTLSSNFYDVIYCSFVLEHVAGAEQVLDRLLAALKPGGLLLLRIPDGDSVYGFLARYSPYWLHVQYKRRIQRNRLTRHAGTWAIPDRLRPGGFVARHDYLLRTARPGNRRRLLVQLLPGTLPGLCRDRRLRTALGG